MRPELPPRAVLVGGLIGGLLAVILSAWIGGPLEAWSEDARLAVREPPPRSDDPRIVLVTISDSTYEILPEPRVFWGRRLSRVIARSSAMGARAIGLDLVPATPVDLYAPELDQELALTLASTPGLAMIYQRVRLPDGRLETLRPHDQLLSALLLGGGLLGHNQPIEDRDGVVRRWEVASAVDGEPGAVELGIPLAVAAQARGVSVALAETEVVLGDRVLRSVVDGVLTIRFRGPPGTFPRIPFETLAADDLVLTEEQRGWLHGAIVLVGSISLADHDVHRMPTTDRRLRALGPGVELQAHAIESLLADDGLRRPPAGTSVIPLMGVVLLGALMFGRLGTLAGLLALILGGGLWTVLVVVGLDRQVLLPWVAPLAAGGGALVGVWSARAHATFLQKREIRGLFERFVPSSVVEELIENPALAILEGQRREITVLFSDIRNFTTLSEGMEADELSRLLNRYLTRMTRILLHHKATVDKYMGDGIMAIFGAPLALGREPERAVRCAVEMVAALEDLRGEWAREGFAGVETFDIGVGVHTGDAFVGNIGSPERMEYTAIGDTVNVAARLESANKSLGTNVLVSAATYAAVESIVTAGRCDDLSVKGRREPVRAHEILDIAPSSSEET